MNTSKRDGLVLAFDPYSAQQGRAEDADFADPLLIIFEILKGRLKVETESIIRQAGKSHENFNYPLIESQAYAGSVAIYLFVDLKFDVKLPLVLGKYPVFPAPLLPGIAILTHRSTSKFVTQNSQLCQSKYDF